MRGIGADDGKMALEQKELLEQEVAKAEAATEALRFDQERTFNTFCVSHQRPERGRTASDG